MNRADDFGAEKVNNDQMSSYEVKVRKNTSGIRPNTLILAIFGHQNIKRVAMNISN